MQGTWLLLLVVSSASVLVLGQREPAFLRKNDGTFHVTVPGFPGVTSVSVTISDGHSEHYVWIPRSQDGSWRSEVKHVKGGEGSVLNYVIQYQLPNSVHKKEGRALLQGETTGIQGHVTRRYLTRRATTVFSDDFSSGSIDLDKWTHMITGWGGGASEFNMYTPEPENSYVRNGMLFIRPTLTVDHFGEHFLDNGTFDANATWGTCRSIDFGMRDCQLSGPGKIPPTMSAMLTSKVSIRYGRVTVNARLPFGDWLWPAIWLLPTEHIYGGWPRSGEIDIMESRGNANYHQHRGNQSSMGVDYTHAAIHYGTRWTRPNERSQTGEYRLPHGNFADSWHSYWMDWTENYIKIGVDEQTILAWDTPPHGYFADSHLTGDNPWVNGSTDAPFDRPFFLVLNVAVGGGWFWSPGMTNAPYPQPWTDSSSKQQKFQDFWAARDLWHHTWHGDRVAMRVRSVTLEQY